jgi:hypothetical protein
MLGERSQNSFIKMAAAVSAHMTDNLCLVRGLKFLQKLARG